MHEDRRGGALLRPPSFIAVSCLSTDDCFAVLLNRYKFLYLTSSGLAPTGELRGCLVSPLIILPRGEGSICGGRTLGVALPCHPSCLSRVCSKTGRLLLCRLPGLRANAARPGFGVPECSGTPGSGRRTSGPPLSPERPNSAETVGAGLCSARCHTQTRADVGIRPYIFSETSWEP